MRSDIAFALLLYLVYACNQKEEVGGELQQTIQQSVDTISVTSFTSRFEQLSYPIKTIGKIRSASSSNLLFEKSGIIESIEVKNGDRVAKGQVIATLKNENEQLQIEEAKVGLQNAEVEYENKMLTIGDSIYYQKRWDDIKNNIRHLTGVTSAKVQLKQAELAMQQTIVRTPISGVIEGIEVQPGDFVETNLELGRVYDASAFELVCEIVEYDVLKIKKGMGASIFLLAATDLNLKGVVTEVNPAVDEKGLARVLIKLLDAKNIIPGLSARVEINVKDQPSIVIPMKAVIKRSERHVVFNLEDGLAKWNYVTLGKNNGEHVQIVEGLEKGMEIIVTNNLQLAHDSPVKLE